MIQAIFREMFHSEPLVVRAPGRINLIGEHTDYNNGFVLPAAINKYVQVALSKRADDTIQLFSVQYGEQVSIEPSDIKPVEKGHWRNYVLGVVDQLIRRGYRIGGFNMMVDGDVPVGAGMSSSAAMECAVAVGLSELFQLNIPPQEIAFIARAAEHAFAGVQCGIMDPFASIFGKSGHAIRLDCRSMEYEYVPLLLGGYTLLLLDTGVKHSLAASAYNERRHQCEAGVEEIKKFQPQVQSLRDVTLPMLQEHITDPLIRRRCGFVIQENIRVQLACAHLQAGDLLSFGQQLYHSHQGLSTAYEVSCAEADFLVEAARQSGYVPGARMMGGGFGGCTINLVQADKTEELVDTLSEQYLQAMGRQLAAYPVETADSAERVRSAAASISSLPTPFDR